MYTVYCTSVRYYRMPEPGAAWELHWRRVYVEGRFDTRADAEDRVTEWWRVNVCLPTVDVDEDGPDGFALTAYSPGRPGAAGNLQVARWQIVETN